jgi:hypothetical protein
MRAQSLKRGLCKDWDFGGVVGDVVDGGTKQVVRAFRPSSRGLL